MERRVCERIELKFTGSESEAKSFSGYGAVFNNIDAYGDMIVPGAFTAYLSDVAAGRQRPPAMLLQHGGMGLTALDELPVGKWSSMSEDRFGLQMEGVLADTAVGNDVYKLLKMDALQGLSIGYIPKEFTPRTKPDEPRRTLKRIDLVEVSIVTRPANNLARVSNVKTLERLGTLRDIEDFLIGEGWSRKEAQTLFARIRGADARDSVDVQGGSRDSATDLRSFTDQYINLLKGCSK